MKSEKYAELMTINQDLIIILNNTNTRLIKKYKEKGDITNTIEKQYNKIIKELEEIQYQMIENY